MSAIETKIGLFACMEKLDQLDELDRQRKE